MAYNKTVWVNGTEPAINAENLNKIENALEAHDTDISDLKSHLTIDLVQIDYNPNMRLGGYIGSDGTLKYNSAYMRTKEIQAGYGTISAVRMTNPSYGMSIAYYDATGAIDGTGFIKRSNEYTNDYHYIPSYAVYFTLSFHKNDGTELTSEDSNTIKESLFAYVTTDTSLTKTNIPADAKATGDAIEALSESIDATADDIDELDSKLDSMLLVAEEIPWYSTSSYPTGFRTGYYTGEVGGASTLTNSSNYITPYYRFDATRYPQLDKVKQIEWIPPTGYAIRVHVIDDSTDEILAIHGEMNTSTHPERAGVPIKIEHEEGHRYTISLGRFSGDASSYVNDSDFIGTFKVIFYYERYAENKYLNKTGEYEFFTVDVERPLSFGGEEVSDATQAETIECVLRLPDTYTTDGEPTRLILACHGATGYIQASTSTWYNSNWKTFMDALLAAGYAVFDANVLPTSTGTTQMGYALGSPLYVNILKKAYDYIQQNYNVKKEIFAHGTSMGGVGASAFSHAYPQLVLAQSSFAGRDFLRYLATVEDETGDDLERFAISYGYDSFADLKADKFSHAEGLFPSLSLVKYVDGVAQIPPVRDTNYADWLAYFDQIADLARNDDVGTWMGKKSVPYKAWNSWADNVAYTKLEEILQKAFNRGNSCPYYIVNYETGTHTEMSYGQINDMIPQLLAWYARWN